VDALLVRAHGHRHRRRLHHRSPLEVSHASRSHRRISRHPTTLNRDPRTRWGCGLRGALYINVGRRCTSSVATTRHGVNINQSNFISGTINDDCKSFETMAGVQLAGVVVKVTNVEERRRIVSEYLKKFPFSTALWRGESSADAIALDPGSHDFYRIRRRKLLFTGDRQARGLAVA
jgi:hypothetical protein